jgi:predicted amidohydrolase
LAACARRHSVYLCAGLVERAGTQIFNAAILFGTDGSLLLRHPKINELEIGHEFYALGERLQVVNTPLVAFGVMICADAFAPAQVISRTLAMMGAQVILSPCARAVPADHNNVREPCGQLWRDNYGPVARDFKIWIAGTSNVGVLEAGPLGGEKMHRVFAAHRSGWHRRAYGTLRCGGGDDTFRGHPAPAATRSGGRLGGSDSQQSLTKWSR